MTMDPIPGPVRLLTLTDWEALPEAEFNRVELQDGVMIVAPSPGTAHQRALGRLTVQLDMQLPPGVEILPGVEVVIEAESPPTVRVPDFAILAADAPEPITAASVVVAVEIISPGSRRMDLVTKRSEYGDAGIPHYWVLHPDGSLTAFELHGGAYTETARAVGTFHTDVPFPLTIDLAALSS